MQQVSSEAQERRKYERVKMLQPLPGRVGKSRVFLLEIGISGIHLIHQGVLPRAGGTFSIEFEWEHHRLEFECEVIHNDLQKLAKSENEKSTYSAGAHFIAAKGDSAVVLRQIVIHHVERALDEQRANARGIPAKAAHAFQTGKAKEFLRCQLVNGEWRKSTSTRFDQPENGFTVSADEEREQVDMLCSSYENGDASTRQMIRMMAEASLATLDGIPTRKYEP